MRRTRHRFLRSEIAVLEAFFRDGLRYPSVGDRLRIADQLKLSERRIYVWFQNRRAAEKREQKDLQ